MSEPTPAEAETTDTITADFDGITIELPALDDVDLDVLIQLETGRTSAAIRSIIGDRWEATQTAYEAAHGRRLKVRDLGRLLDVVSVAYGFKDAGE